MQERGIMGRLEKIGEYGFSIVTTTQDICLNTVSKSLILVRNYMINKYGCFHTSTVVFLARMKYKKEVVLVNFNVHTG